MTKKTTVLLALLAPPIAMLAACATDHQTAATSPSMSSTVPADTGMASSGTSTGMTSTGMTSTGMGATTSGSSTTSTGMMGSMDSSSASFSQMDKNQDGSITRDELSSTDSISSNFSSADTNGDGKLSETEFNAARGNPSPAQ